MSISSVTPRSYRMTRFIRRRSRKQLALPMCQVGTGRTDGAEKFRAIAQNACLLDAGCLCVRPTANPILQVHGHLHND